MSLTTREVRTILTTQDLTKGDMNRVQSSLSGITRMAGLAGAALGSLGLARIAEQMVATTDRFQKLDDMLATVTGSSQAAGVAMSWLTDFAKETPYQLQEVIEAFVKMKSLGLDASEEALRSYGNTASAMGKDLNQMIEAVADASVGEFERLKEFGIKANKEGDQIKFTFQGVTTTVRNSAQEITSYMQDIGNNQFATGMSSQLDNIGTALSNLGAGWDDFMVALGETGLIDAATEGIIGLTSSLEAFSNSLKLLKAYQEDKISLWEFITADPEDARKLLEKTALMDTELVRLEARVKELMEHKQGNFWWSRAEEADLQQALQALEYYKLSLGDVGRLKSAAQHSVYAATGAAAPTGDASTPQDLMDYPLGAAMGMGQQDYSGFGLGALEMLEQASLDTTARINAEYQVGLASRLEMLQQQYMSEEELMWQRYENEALLVEEAHTAGLLSRQEYVDAMRQIDEEHAGNQMAIENQVLAMKQANVQSALQLMQMFVGKSKVLALAGLAVQKGLAIAETFINTQAAAAAALAPPPLGLGPVAGAGLAGAIEAQGAIRMGLIAATGLVQAAQAIGAPSTGFGYGGGTPSSPIATQPTFQQQPDQSVTIVLRAIPTGKYVEEEIIPMINEAGRRDVRIEYVPEA